MIVSDLHYGDKISYLDENRVLRVTHFWGFATPKKDEFEGTLVIDSLCGRGIIYPYQVVNKIIEIPVEQPKPKSYKTILEGKNFVDWYCSNTINIPTPPWLDKNKKYTIEIKEIE